MTKVTDEMLMAFADGELDEATAAEIARAVAADHVLAGRLEAFRQTRLVAKQAFADALEEPVPERLLEAAGRRPARSGGRWSWRSWTLPAGIAVAASLAGFLLALSTFADRIAPPMLPAGAQIAAALDTVASGEAATLGGVSVEPTATYVADDEVCRTFRLRGGGADTDWLGVACRRDGTWQVEMAVADRQGDGGFVPASDRAAESVDAFLEIAGAGDRLDAAGEDRLRQSGWRPLP